VVFTLRQAGHDVLAIAETAKGVADEQVMERALRGHRAAGVILVKFHSRARRAKPAAVVETVAKLGARLQDGFAVVEPGRVRIARRPQN